MMFHQNLNQIKQLSLIMITEKKVNNISFLSLLIYLCNNSETLIFRAYTTILCPTAGSRNNFLKSMGGWLL